MKNLDRMLILLRLLRLLLCIALAILSLVVYTGGAVPEAEPRFVHILGNDRYLFSVRLEIALVVFYVSVLFKNDV